MICLRNKGTVTLLIALSVLAAITILVTSDLNAVFAPAAPRQVYSPIVLSADEKVVCIAFDDGWKTHTETVPILERYNFTASYSIITSYVGYPAYMNWEDIAYVAQKGNDIVSHTDSHSNLSAVDAVTLQKELVDSRQILRSKGYGADVLIYPYGEAAANETVRDAVAGVYQVATGTQAGKCDLYSVDRLGVNSYVIYRGISLETFGSYLNGTGGNTVTVLYYHKVGDENSPNSISKADFEAQMQYLSDNGYTVKTLSQLFLKTTQ